MQHVQEHVYDRWARHFITRNRCTAPQKIISQPANEIIRARKAENTKNIFQSNCEKENWTN